MSEQIFKSAEMVVASYVGPTRRDGGVRTRYQFVLEIGGDYDDASLSYEEASRLKAALTLSLAKVGAGYLAD